MTQCLTVSVVMASYHRHAQLEKTLSTFLNQTTKPDEIIVVEDGYDDELTEAVCKSFEDRLPIKWLCRRNRPALKFSCPAVPRNIGIKQAKGEIILIQCPEVMFTKRTDFANIIGPVQSVDHVSCCAPCEAITDAGNHQMWYADQSREDYAFGSFNCYCQAYRRQPLLELGGFDERFIGYSPDDSNFNVRVRQYGIATVWAKDVVVKHQWHTGETDLNYLAHNNHNDSLEYQLIANVGKEWGRIDS